MGRYVDDSQTRRGEHHRDFGSASEIRQELSVPGESIAGGVHRFLAQRRGADCLDGTDQGKRSGALDIAKGGFGSCGNGDASKCRRPARREPSARPPSGPN